VPHSSPLFPKESQHSLSSSACCCTCMAGISAQRNRNAVPRVDRCNHQRKIYRLHIAEVRPHLVVYGIWCVTILNIGHDLSPGQRCPLPLGGLACPGLRLAGLAAAPFLQPRRGQDLAPGGQLGRPPAQQVIGQVIIYRAGERDPASSADHGMG